MPTAQPAIFREYTPHHYFLEFHRKPRWNPADLFGRAEDGLMDRLTEFSQPVSGACWYAPPVEKRVELFGCAPA